MQSSIADRDARVALGLFFLVWVVYGWFWGGGGWAQNSHFALTRSLVIERDVAIDEYARTTGDLSRVGDRLITNKAPGLSILGAPPYAIARALIPGEDRGLVVTLRAWSTNLFSNALLGALIAPLFYLMARREGEARRRALLFALGVAVATPLLPYATVFFLHDASAGLMFAAYLAALRPTLTRALAAGILAGLAALTNYLFLPVIPALALFAVARGDRDSRGVRWRAGAATIAGSLPPMALFAWYQWAATGRIFELPLNENPQFVDRNALLFGLVGYPDPWALWGITFSPYRGLFFLAPVLLLAIPGVFVMARAKRWAELLFIAFVVAVFFGFNVTFNGWEGGFGIGARYLVPLVPFLAVLAFQARRLVPVAVVILLAAVSLANNVAATAVDPLPSGSIGNPLGEYVYPLLLTGTWEPEGPMHPLWTPPFLNGHTSVSRHAIDEKLPFQNAPPGSPEAEWAAFNLGEMVTGPGSAASLVPLLFILGGGAWMLFRYAKEDPAREA